MTTSRLKLILALSVLFLIQSTCAEAQANNPSFFSNMFKHLTNRPIYGFSENTIFQESHSGMSRIGFGFDGEVYDTAALGLDYIHRKQFRRTQFLNFSVGKKYYADNKENNYYYSDFTLLKTSIRSEAWGSLIIGGNLSLIDKKTDWYSINEVSWFNLGFDIGYDFTSGNTDLIIAPSVNLNFGVSTLKPDTNNLKNLDKKFDKLAVNGIGGNIKLKIAYKAFSLDLYSGGGGSALNLYRKNAELSYTFWKNRDYAVNGEHIQYLLNFLKIYLSYSNDEVNFDKIEDDKTIIEYSIRRKSINFGASIRLGKIDF